MSTRTKIGPWKLQDLPSKPGYPNWTPYAIRDCKTNICIAIVGTVDRYFEGKQQLAHARLMKAAPDLLKNLQRCAQWIEDSVGECPAIDDDWENGHSELAEAKMAIADALKG